MIKTIKKLIPPILITATLVFGIYILAKEPNFGAVPAIALENIQEAYDDNPQIQALYRIENSAFIKDAKDENSVKVEIGDKTKTEFIPELRLSRWEDEVYLKVKPRLNAKTKKKELELENEKIKYKEDKKEYHFYEVENGYEFEIVLLEKPDTNVITMDIESEGLNFYYQDALNIEEADNPEVDYCTETECYKDGEVIIYRPENVVGSYAVYHSTKQGHILGQKNYKTGKAFHIYRPKITDAVGNWAWEENNIENGKITITIPQEFLDNAIYPIRSTGETFGDTGIGGTETKTGSGGNWAVKFTSGVAGNAEHIRMYTKHDGDGGNVDYALYLGSDKSLVANTTATVLPSSATWLEKSISASITATVEYGISFWFSEDGWTYYDSGGTDQSIIDISNSYPTWPNPMDWSCIWTPSDCVDRSYSIYCTYEAEAPPPAVKEPQRIEIIIFD